MLTYARSALLLRPFMQTGRATARALSATPYLDRAKRGPVWSALTETPDEATLEKDGRGVCAWLGEAASAPKDLDPKVAARVYDLYLPAYYWCKAIVDEHPRTPCVIFMSAPQGCGKTTLCNALVERFAADGKECAALSYDDFYLTHAEQTAVAAQHHGNRLLELRGNGGTHDLELFDRVLTQLKATGKAQAPRYDKTAHNGFGDRAGLVDIRAADVVLVEGWMAGFKPVRAAAAAINADLGAVDAHLGAYGTWDAHADAWLVVALESPADTVYGWRREAERRADGGLSDDQVRDFVGRFLPSYAAYCPALYAAAAAGGVDAKPTLRLDVDTTRSPVGAASS